MDRESAFVSSPAGSSGEVANALQSAWQAASDAGLDRASRVRAAAVALAAAPADPALAALAADLLTLTESSVEIATALENAQKMSAALESELEATNHGVLALY